MYGIVNKAIEELVTQNFGQEAWEGIRKRSKIEVDFCLTNEAYDDSITYRLNIIQQLVELMGGTIKVKSVKNEGRLFLIDLEFQKGNIDNIENETSCIHELASTFQKDENTDENIDKITAFEIAIYDLNYLKEAFGDAPEAINSLLEAFIKEGELGILQINDYLESRNTEGLRATAHRLKANVAMLNSHELYNKAIKIETQARLGIFTEELMKNTIVFKSGLAGIIEKIKSEIGILV